MKYYKEPPKQIPIIADVDVLVLGSGPAGFSTAISAARKGAQTMLIEQGNSVGGIATSGLMSHWTGNTQGGLYQEIIERTSDCEDTKIINPEKLKTVMLQMLQQENILLRLYTLATEPIIENNTIKGVIIESKSGREVVMAKVVIDATGDGDIAARAGVPFIKGKEDDGKMQPMTLMFKIAGVDTDKAVLPGSFESNFDIPKGKIQDLGKQSIPFPAGHVLLYRSSLPGIITCNMTNCIDVDGTSVDDLTQAEFVCRNQMEPIVKFLKEYVPGFENCFIISSASLIGVRETRHFQGEYTLTEQDILDAKVFDDWVVTKAHFNFDVHNVSGPGLDSTGVQHEFPQPKGYTIPYRCLIPKNIDNLLLAGRNISGTHMAHSNFRAMPICANIGQAAGIAAALCVEHDVCPRDLDIELLQSSLILEGVEL